jgi:hypothetical protein
LTLKKKYNAGHKVETERKVTQSHYNSNINSSKTTAKQQRQQDKEKTMSVTRGGTTTTTWTNITGSFCASGNMGTMHLPKQETHV